MAEKAQRTGRISNGANTTEDVVAAILKGENLERALATLSPAEKLLFNQLVSEIRSGRHGKEMLQDLWRIDYSQQPPRMSEFLESDYYLGQVTRMTLDNPGVWPTWRAVLERDWDTDSRINNCVITGSLGIGKTWNMVIILLYRVALTSMLRNPTNFVGLAAGSRLIYVLMSVTQAQVQDTAMGDAMMMMSKSPFFVEKLKFNPSSKYSSGVIDLGEHIQLNAGSRSQHIIGRNTLGIGMDEGNFRLEADPDMKAYRLYNEIRTRIKNRFQKTSGFLPAVSIIASSARDESSFTENVIKEIEEANDRTSQVVYRESAYRLKSAERWLELGTDAELVDRHAIKFADRYFKVSYGLKSAAPKVLQGWFNSEGVPLSQNVEQPAAGSRTELIPAEYQGEFSRDVIRGLQNIAGISIGGSYRLFTSMVDFDRAIDAGTKLGLENPCTVPIIPLSEEDDREIWDFLDHKSFLKRETGRVIPKRNPTRLRFAHMDLATKSYAGISIGHVVGWREVQGLLGADHRVFSEHRLVFQYDLILTISSGKTKPISFEKITKFFLWLRDKAGFNFGLITADQFQSVMQLQILQNRGFPTGDLSLDRSKAPYYSWRQAFEEGRILMFHQQRCYDEAANLIDHPKKVDHPIAVAGEYVGKDTTDGAAGAAYNGLTQTASVNADSSDFARTAVLHESIVPSSDFPSFVVPIAPVRREARVFSA